MQKNKVERQLFLQPTTPSRKTIMKVIITARKQWNDDFKLMSKKKKSLTKLYSKNEYIFSQNRIYKHGKNMKKCQKDLFRE